MDDVPYGDCNLPKVKSEDLNYCKKWIILDTNNPEYMWECKDDPTILEHVLYVHRAHSLPRTVPSIVEFETDLGKHILGTFSYNIPDIRTMNCYLKFEKYVTFRLLGPGPVHIFGLEVEKPKPKKDDGLWKGVKKLVGQYMWKGPYFGMIREKTD